MVLSFRSTYWYSMKNLVLAMADGYNTLELAPFVKSLRGTGFTGDLVLFVSPNTAKQLQSFASRYEITLVHLSRVGRWFSHLRPLVALKRQVLHEQNDLHTFVADRWKHHPVVGRFSYYRQFIAENSEEYEKVLLCDVRDVVFQSNPFTTELPADICLFAEHASHSIDQSESNARWIRRSFGQKTLNALSKKPIICGGVMLGTTQGMIRFLDQLVAAMAACPANWSLRFGLDQAALNYIAYEVGIPNSHIFECCVGPAAHLALVPDSELAIKSDGHVLDRLGNVIPLLHQYDRHKQLLRLAQQAA